MSRNLTQVHNENLPFICEHCGCSVMPPESGTEHRNHCPHCCYSKHVDMRTGDRRSGCKGLMEPIGIWVDKNKEWSLIHRCRKCGFIRINRIAPDDSEMLLFSLALKPMIQLPFPSEFLLEQLKKNTPHGEIK